MTHIKFVCFTVYANFKMTDDSVYAVLCGSSTHSISAQGRRNVRSTTPPLRILVTEDPRYVVHHTAYLHSTHHMTRLLSSSHHCTTCTVTIHYTTGRDERFTAFRSTALTFDESDILLQMLVALTQYLCWVKLAALHRLLPAYHGRQHIREYIL
jgi:hypothetical protein